MTRRPHQNVATVLVRPRKLLDLELGLMTRDLWLWPVASAPLERAGARLAGQLRTRLVVRQHGAWDEARDWTPTWIGFGDTWRDGAEPLSWSAHTTLWSILDDFGEHVRFARRLVGIPPFGSRD